MDEHHDLPPATPPPPDPMPVVSQPEPEKELYSWLAPARLFKRRNREFYSTVAALVILLSIILLFAKEFLLIAVILSLGFVSYVLASIEPPQVHHLLTNRGIRTSDKLYRWETIRRYWWEEKWHENILHFEIPGQYPGKILLLLGLGDKEAIETIVDKYAVKDKPDPTWLDKAAKWLQEKVPLESSDEPPQKTLPQA